MTALYRYIRPQTLRRSPTMSAGKLAQDAQKLGVQVDMFTVGDLFPKPTEEEVQSWVQQLRSEAAKPEHKTNPLYMLRPAGKARAYSETTGIPSLRAAIAKHFMQDTGIDAETKHVMVGNGGKGALSGALYYLTSQANKTVLLAAPGWPTNYDLFPPATMLHEVDTAGRGIMSPAELQAALAQGEEPAIVFINAPSNPTGANYSAVEREEIIGIIRTHTKHTVLVMDDPYGKLVFDSEPYDIATVLMRGAHEKALFAEGRMAVFRTASKEYGMADSRVGWVITRNTTLLESLQSYNESIGGGMSARNQLEVQAALMFGDGFITRTQAALMQKRALLIEGISKLRYARMAPPQATIYGWIDFSGLIGLQVPADATPDGKSFRIDSPAAMLRYLVNVAGVCAVAGTAFYAPDSPAAAADWHVRFSFCNETEELTRGISKLAAAEQRLAKLAA
jgi:aspartate aminotransferase